MKKILFLFLLLSAALLADISSPYKEVVDHEIPFVFESENGPRTIVYNSIIDWQGQKIIVNSKMNLVTPSAIELKNNYLMLSREGLKRASIILDNVNIDCKNKISDFKSQNSDFTIKLSKYISSLDTVEKSYKNNILSYTISIPIVGNNSVISLFIDSYLPAHFSFNLFEIFKFFSTPLYASDNTGLIIDARKIKLNPALLPKITNGKTDVYSPKNLDKKTLEENGTVQYVVVGKKVTLAEIKKEALLQKNPAVKRTGTNPKIIEAYAADGPLKTDAIISQADADSISNSQAVKEGKVTIIVDASVGGIIGRKIGDYDILTVSGIWKWIKNN